MPFYFHFSESRKGSRAQPLFYSALDPAELPASLDCMMIPLELPEPSGWAGRRLWQRAREKRVEDANDDDDEQHTCAGNGDGFDGDREVDEGRRVWG